MSTSTRARPWLMGILAALLAAPAGAADVTSGNVCAKQIGDFLSSNRGQTLTAVEFRYVDRLGGSRREPRTLTQAVAQVAECPGYHFFEVLGNEYVCERQSQVGSERNLVLYRSSGDGC